MNMNQMYRDLSDTLDRAKAIAKQAMGELDYDNDSQAYGKERRIEGAWDNLCDLQSEFNELADHNGSWNW